MKFSMNWNQSYQKTLLIDSDLVLFEHDRINTPMLDHLSMFVL